MFARVLVLLSIFGVALGGVAYLKWRQMEEAMGQQMQPPPSTVSATEVKEESWRPTLNAVGSMVAVQGIEVSAEVSGMVNEVAFGSGESVEEGQLLLRLDDEVDQAALDALRADRQLAQIDFQRARELLPKKAVSKADFDKAQANLQAKDAQMAQQQAVLEQKRIHAPFTGVLGIRRVDPGQFLNAGEAIVSLNMLDPIYVDFALAERHIGRLEEGLPLRVKVDAYPDEVFEGEIGTIDTDVDAATRTLRVRGVLRNDDKRLRPGMFAEVRVVRPEQERVLTIPRTAVSFNSYGDFVYRLEEGEDGGLTVKRAQIESGKTRNGRVAVSKGLQAGDRIVRTGLVKLRDGAAVRIDNTIVLDDGAAANKDSGADE